MQFFQKQFNFTVKLSWGFKNRKTTLIKTNAIFHSKAENYIGFFLQSPVYAQYSLCQKTGNPVKWGKKIRLFKLAQEIQLLIYQTLCFLSLIKNHPQKLILVAISVHRGRNYGL